MGFNPFKSLKKIVKKIGKGIKKIGKGIKGVMGKIMKPFAKLGIVGQIALGFIMPWAAGAIFSGFGTLATSMAASSNMFIKAAGTVMKGIHAGASAVKGAFTKVTDAISGGLETVTGKAKEMFGIKADASDFIKNAPEMKEFDFGSNLSEKAISDVAATKTIEGQLASTIPDAIGKVTDSVIGDISKKATEETLLGSIKKAAFEAPGKLVDGTIASTTAGIKEGIARSISPEGDINYPPNVVDMLGTNNTFSSVFNEKDLVAEDAKLQSQGGMFGGLVHGAVVQTNSSFGLEDTEWSKYMKGLQGAR
tara:strand:+ start:316 stop:1236 length:921 start_codon:yes stop_codon:yes gene_type:complete